MSSQFSGLNSQQEWRTSLSSTNNASTGQSTASGEGNPNSSSLLSMPPVGSGGTSSGHEMLDGVHTKESSVADDAFDVMEKLRCSEELPNFLKQPPTATGNRMYHNNPPTAEPLEQALMRFNGTLQPPNGGGQLFCGPIGGSSAGSHGMTTSSVNSGSTWANSGTASVASSSTLSGQSGEVSANSRPMFEAQSQSYSLTTAELIDQQRDEEVMRQAKQFTDAIDDKNRIMDILLNEAAVNQDFRKHLRFVSTLNSKLLIDDMKGNDGEWDEIVTKGGPCSLEVALGGITKVVPTTATIDTAPPTQRGSQQPNTIAKPVESISSSNFVPVQTGSGHQYKPEHNAGWRLPQKAM